MESFRPSHGRISSNFDSGRITLSAHVYFMMLSHSMQSKDKNSKNRFNNDVITYELYWLDRSIRVARPWHGFKSNVVPVMCLT